MLCSARCGKDDVICFLDTGASISLVSLTYVKSLGPAVVVKPTSVKLKSFSNDTIPALGQVELQLDLADTRITGTFIVTQSMSSEFLVGMELMQQGEINIDMANGRISTKHGFADLLAQRPPCTPSKIRCLKAVTIPANSVYHMMAKVKGIQQSREYTGYVDPYNNLLRSTGIMVAAIAVQTERGQVPIKCINLSDEPVTLRKGNLVGYLRESITMDREVKGVRVAKITVLPNTTENPKVTSQSEDGSHKGSWTPESLFESLRVGEINLKPEEKARLKDILWEHKEAFSMHDNDLGTCTIWEADLNLKKDAEPQWVPSIPVAYKQRPFMAEELKRKEAAGVIEQCTSPSPWNSRVFLVRKPKSNKPDSYRFVADMRAVNSQCLPDSYELPNVNNVMEAVAGCSLYSTFDLSQSFHQLKYSERSKPITAFTAFNGIRYWFARMIMGHRNSSAIFTRMMNKLLANVPVEHLVYFLDDLLLASHDVTTHLTNLEMILRRFTKANLKLSPSKCNFLKKEVQFVGLTLNQHGVKINDDRVSALQNIKEPRNVKETQKVLRFFGYNRKFIRHYAAITGCLYKLLKKDQKFVWTDECQHAFDTLKKAVMDCTSLCLPDVEDPLNSYEVTVDGSNKGMGATLSQIINAERRTVAFYSKVLPSHKRQWGQTKIEFTTMVNALEHWQLYLRGTTFTVVTDCLDLLNLDTIFLKNNSTMYRKLQTLAKYNFVIRHISGEENHVADFLSRYLYENRMVEQGTQTEECLIPTPVPLKINSVITEEGGDLEQLIPQQFFTEQNPSLEATSPSPSTPADEQATSSPISKICTCTPKEPANTKDHDVHDVRAIQVTDGLIDAPIVQDLAALRKGQEEDLVLRDVKSWLIAGVKPSSIQHTRVPPDLVRYWKQFSLLEMKEDIIRRKWVKVDRTSNELTTEALLIAVPEAMRLQTMMLSHSSLLNMHPGVEESMRKCRQHFYWPKMEDDLKIYIGSCTVCAQNKQTTAYLKAPLKHIVVHSFNDAISIDHIVPSREAKTPRRNRYILSITDVFTGFVTAVPVKSQESKATIEALIQHWVLRNGMPKEILADNHPGFTSKFFNAVLRAFNIKSTHGTAYKCSSTSKAERSNKRLNQALRVTLTEGQLKNWDLYLDYVCFALNGMKSRHTGYSANFLRYGCELNTPLSLLMDDEQPSLDLRTPHGRAAHEIHSRMRGIIARARKHAALDYASTDNTYNRKLQGPYFEENSWCLLLIECPKHKFSQRWRGPYQVKKVINQHLYVVSIADGQEKVVNIGKMKHYKYSQYSPAHVQVNPSKTTTAVSRHTQLPSETTQDNEGASSRGITVVVPHQPTLTTERRPPPFTIVNTTAHNAGTRGPVLEEAEQHEAESQQEDLALPLGERTRTQEHELSLGVESQSPEASSRGSDDDVTLTDDDSEIDEQETDTGQIRESYSLRPVRRDVAYPK